MHGALPGEGGEPAESFWGRFIGQTDMITLWWLSAKY